ncbi:uncharacterized protein LOC112567110 [Pomacea canaliculata]|uniref:uncharacterized protein LOC112567110 n=1 Tax=Pomacea canaliculata TaxID=400727 RepID=UPI000D72CFD0|nr:uncharacterized protein LOC112567110 [Pomacea canaliculata]
MAASPSPFPQSTSTGSYHDSGNKSSSIHFFGSALGNSSSSSKNVLDYPGEDIQFMDDDGRIRSRHASGNDKRSSTIFFQIPRPMVTVGSGYSNNGTTSPRAVLRGRQTRHLPRAPHISLNNNRGDRGVKGPAHTLCLGPRGGVRTGLTSPIHRPTPRRAPPQPPSGGRVQLLYGYGSWQEDSDDNNGARRGLGGGVLSEKLLKNKTSEKKEKLYSKVAQKVITIADAFSAETGLSDSEAHHKTGYQEAAVSLTDLENLEKEIIDCLRRKGDELSHKIDAPAEKLVEQTKAQTYERFEKTIQHSLGNEVSWNHLALLFYSAKMVVKAVGRSSAATKEVTEMTLRYFSDKFSSWIIDQGGFETLAESDSELE